MIETGKASIAVVLATWGLLGWACNPAAAAVHIEGQVQAAAVHSQIPPSPYGKQMQAIPNNWLKRKPVVMDVLNLAPMKRLAQMSAYIWLPKVFTPSLWKAAQARIT